MDFENNSKWLCEVYTTTYSSWQAWVIPVIIEFMEEQVHIYCVEMNGDSDFREYKGILAVVHTALKMELLWEEAGVWSVPDFCGRLVFKTQPVAEAATQWDRFIFEN